MHCSFFISDIIRFAKDLNSRLALFRHSTLAHSRSLHTSQPLMSYERLVASESIEATNEEALGSVIRAQNISKARRLIRDKVERILWFGAFVALVWLGDGSNNLAVVLSRGFKTKRWFARARPSNVFSICSILCRAWFILALSSLAINFCIFCYLVRFHDFHRRGSKWETGAKWALPVSCFLGAGLFIRFEVLLLI